MGDELSYEPFAEDGAGYFDSFYETDEPIPPREARPRPAREHLGRARRGHPSEDVQPIGEPGAASCAGTLSDPYPKAANAGAASRARSAREILEQILGDPALSSSAYPSQGVSRSEPIIATGADFAAERRRTPPVGRTDGRMGVRAPEQAAFSFTDTASPSRPRPIDPIPERYREMRSIPRFVRDAPAGTATGPTPIGSRATGGGRWLSEAEFFYRQAKFMEDFEDDFPCQGNLRTYFPTYNSMSDRQLRGYFTWRAEVRRGNVQENATSFAFVYLYELINGIGVDNPQEGYRRIREFWGAYRVFAPELDRYVRAWLTDYVVYHGLDPALLADTPAAAFDRALIELRAADTASSEASRHLKARSGQRTRARGSEEPSALPLPPDEKLEQSLFEAIDALSTHHLPRSALFREKPEMLRHIACAVFVRMSEYYRTKRQNSLLESLFGKKVELVHQMFASAVFFEEHPHPDGVWELDELCRYRCEDGVWTCERLYNGRSKSSRLGDAMRSVDRMLRERLGIGRPLKETSRTPKYLAAFIEREMTAWARWRDEAERRRISIDLSQLDSIRDAAAKTREALLIDEEREGSALPGDAAPSVEAIPETGFSKEPEPETVPPAETIAAAAGAVAPPAETVTAATPSAGTGPATVLPSEARAEATSPAKTAADPHPAPPTPGCSPSGSGLTEPQLSYLGALLQGDDAGKSEALERAGCSEDLLVDAINEVALEVVGDTIVEYGDSGPQIVEDYRPDIEGMLTS